MIYEAGEQQQSSADHSNVAFEPQTNSSTSANHQDKLSSEANDIPLTDEDLLQRIHHDENSDAAIAGSDAPASLLVYTGDGIPVSSSTIIDASKLYGPGTVTIADFAQSQSVTYMASILSQNEPEDLTGNRRGSNADNGEVSDGLQ